jgi:ATP-binding cassette, subfamily C, bacterial
MIRLIRMFFGSKGANPWMVLLCLTFASLAQGFGIATLVPLISLVSDDQAQHASAAGKAITDILGYLGLPVQLGVLLLVVVSATLLKSVMTVFAMIYVARAVADVANGLRADLIKALMKARWSYFTSKPTGVLVNSVGMESSISGVVYLMFSRFLSSVIQTVIYVAVAFAVSWKLALISLLVGGTIALLLHFFVRMSEKAGKRGLKRSRELVARLSDAIMGIKPLKAMGREDEFGRLFLTKIKQIRNAARREIVSKNLLSNLQEPLLMIMMAGGFYVLVAYLQMPISTVLVTGVLLQRTVNSLGKLQMQYQEAIATESAHRSVRRIIDEAHTAREPSSGRMPATFEIGCVFRDVWFSFGNAPVLRGVNLQIPARRLTLVIGPSGTGKTTLTDLLLGFYQPDRGEIMIDGVPLQEIDIRSWRRSIGYVPQELILLHDSILANITLGDSSIGEEQAVEALRVAGAGDFIARLPDGVHTEVGEKGARFSGGQRQRIAIARALVHRPKLLILDEVTSALDAATEREICENIRNIAKSITVLAISHRQAWVEVADSVNYLRLQENERTTHATC